MENYFRKQVGDTACGLASLAIIFDMVLEKESFSTEQEVYELQMDQSNPMGMEIFATGSTLEELSRLAWHAGLPHTVVFASEFKDLDAFRRALKRMLDLGRKIIVNYHMTTAGQAPFGGHHSPLDCFDESKDAFRIYDVWKQTKEDFVWVPTSMLWQACLHMDTSSNRERGFMVFVDRLVQSIHVAKNEVLSRNGGFMRWASKEELEEEGEMSKEAVRFINAIYSSKKYFKENMRRIELDGFHAMARKDQIRLLYIDTEPRSVLGVVQFEQRNEDEGFWGLLVVAPSCKGTGLASLLMDVAELGLMKLGITKICLDYLDDEATIPALGLNYTKKGYLPTGSHSPTPHYLQVFKPEYANAQFIDCTLTL